MRVEQRANNDAKDRSDFRHENSEQERFGLLYNGLRLTCRTPWTTLHRRRPAATADPVGAKRKPGRRPQTCAHYKLRAVRCSRWLYRD